MNQTSLICGSLAIDIIMQYEGRFGDTLKKVRVVQGKDNVERRLTPTYDDSLPKDHDKNLYLWIQDGWQTEEKSVIAEAKAKSSDNPTLFAFLPAQHKTELTNAIVALEAARTTLQKKGSKVTWGEDLGAEDEALLVEDYETPIFICNYPKEAKAFYMKENPADPRTVLCDDMFAPEGYGEIIGGSQREDDYDKLLHRIREEKLPEDAYSWYLDLRKYGTFVHSGFGLGLERTAVHKDHDDHERRPDAAESHDAATDGESWGIRLLHRHVRVAGLSPNRRDEGICRIANTRLDRHFRHNR